MSIDDDTPRWSCGTTTRMASKHGAVVVQLSSRPRSRAEKDEPRAQQRGQRILGRSAGCVRSGAYGTPSRPRPQHLAMRNRIVRPGGLI